MELLTYLMPPMYIPPMTVDINKVEDVILIIPEMKLSREQYGCQFLKGFIHITSWTDLISAVKMVCKSHPTSVLVLVAMLPCSCGYVLYINQHITTFQILKYHSILHSKSIGLHAYVCYAISPKCDTTID